MTIDRRCPECGSADVRPFAPTPWGYWCGDCKHTWDDEPEDE